MALACPYARRSDPPLGDVYVWFVKHLSEAEAERVFRHQKTVECLTRYGDRFDVVTTR